MDVGCVLVGVSASVPSLEVRVSQSQGSPAKVLSPACGPVTKLSQLELEVGSLEEGVGGGVLDCVVLGLKPVCHQRDYRGPQWLSER